MALHSQRTFHDIIVVVSLTVSSGSYFLQQNDAIRKCTVKGLTINLKVLGIGDGITVRRLECLAG